MLKFNSRNIKYKCPFGALPTDTEMRINFPVPDNYNAAAVSILISLDNRITKIRLFDVSRDDGYLVFSGHIGIHTPGIYYYYFEITFNDGTTVPAGKTAGGGAEMHSAEKWQLTVFEKDYKTPDKFKGGIYYQIFPDRFKRSEKIKFDGHKGYFRDDWGGLSNLDARGDGIYHADDFFGGDIEGIISKLPYLSELGVTIIYLNPIFESCSNHRYDTGDYMKIDSLLGTESDLKKLCAEAKKLGISIILDGVLNHTGADSRYFDKFNNYKSDGAYQNYFSPYRDWFYFDDYPRRYKSWWGIDNVPTVNKENLFYRDFIMGGGGVIEKWQKAGIAGWRLDVVDELPVDFLTAVCKKIKSLDKNNLIIGEVWEDASTKVSYGELRPYLLGEQIDGTMNYPFMRAVIDYVKGGAAEDFINTVMTILENYPRPSIDVLMNILDTHDTVRILNTLSDVPRPERKDQAARRLEPDEYARAKKLLMLASAIQYMLPGNPCIYYGDEAGLTGWSDPFNRACYRWGGEDTELLEHYKKLGSLRKDNREAMRGEAEFEIKNGLLCITRYKENEKITLLCNNGNVEINGIPSKSFKIIQK